ncbi:histidine phosphatase family protein [Brucella tritici]|uniref:Histidine phosphatase family protein n=1 Tax=Brucella tritici TaxID=94626 RepID=A0A7V8B2F3_9HYPH|nr:histidine phosphatase family protein [Brucella tritici]KAB2656938.1 histidine phosphatase family protein [Brucella tritici]
MTKIYFISHPEVVIDPAKPIPSWNLSEHGIERMRSFASQPELQSITLIWSSTETKAIEAAEILAGALRVNPLTDNRFNEIDRSATGFLPAEQHEIIADRFFSAPETSICGWERAVDVQQRIVEGFGAVRRPGTSGDIAIVGHGGAGTLLLCFLAGLPISRQHDQPFQGHYWCYSSEDNAVLHHWKPIAPR